MAITLTAGTSVESTTSVTSSVVTLPAMIVGDYGVVVVSLNASGGAITTPNGWTNILASTQSVNGSSSDVLAIFYRAYVAGDPTALTVATTNGRVAITPFVASGFDPSTFVDVTSSVSQLASGATTLTAPAITPTTSCVVWVVNGRATTSGVFMTPMTAVGTTELAESSGKSTSLNNAGHAIIVNTAATPGASSGTKSATPANATTGAMGFTFSLTPATGGAANHPVTDAVTSSDSLSVVVPAATMTYKVEVGFGSSPDSATQTWTDISAYADMSKGININRGRTDQFSGISVGQMSLTLNNTDGRFTPENTAGAYYPNVVLGKRIRVTAINGSNVQVRFDGRVDTWPVDLSPTGTYSEVVVHASDRLKKLAQQQNLKNVYSIAVLADSPTAYFPLGDTFAQSAADGDSVANWAPGGSPASVKQIGQYGQGTLLFGQTTGGPYVDGLTSAAWREFNSPPDGLVVVLNSKTPLSASDGSFSMECWVWSSSTQPNADGTLMGIGRYYRDRWTMQIQDGFGNLNYGYSRPGQGDLYDLTDGVFTDSGVINDSATHHVVMTYDRPSDTMRLFVDGVRVYSQVISTTPGWSVGSSPSRALYCVSLGGVEYTRVGPGLLVGTMSHCAVYDYRLSDAQVLNHYTVGTTGYGDELSDARFVRICGWAGITDTIVDEPGLTKVTWQDTTSKTIVELLNQVADTEQGIVFADRAGPSMRFQGRAHRWNAPVATTLTAGQYEPDLQPVLDDQQVVNDFTVTRAGTTRESKNNASIAANGVYSGSLDSICQYVDDVSALAQWRANVAATPKVKYPSVPVDLRTLPKAVIDSLLALDIGSCFNLSGLPSQAPASTASLFVEGYTEDISLVQHRIVFNTSVNNQKIFTVGDPVLGKLDSTSLIPY